MSAAGYQIRDQFAVHFLTFATVDRVDVFTHFPQYSEGRILQILVIFEQA